MKRILRPLATIGLTLGLAWFATAPASAQDAAAEPAPGSDDPRVRALLATNPSSAEDLFRVSMLLVDLKYPQVAKPLVDKLIETTTEEPQLAALGRKVGMLEIYRLAEVKEFQPQAAEFVKRVVDATNKANRDPARLAELIEQLKSPDLGTQAAAVLGLRTGGEAAAQALVDVLADPARKPEHRTIATALAGIGDDGLAPLSEIAAHGDDVQRKLVLDVLGYVENDAAEAPLFTAAFAADVSDEVRKAAEAAVVRRNGALPKPVEAAASLFLEARNTYRKQPPAGDRDAKAAVWRWDAATKKPVSTLVVKRSADLDRAARLAAQAAAISGNDTTAQLLAYAAALESALAAAGDDAATRQTAAQKWADAVKPDAVQLGRVLELSLEEKHYPTAIAAARLLGNAAGARALEAVNGRPSLLVRAVQSADRRLSFAALEEVVRLNPQTPFIGAGAVTDALGYFASSTGLRKALVVDKNAPRGRDVAGIVAALGYQCELATDARSAAAILGKDADYELVLMYRPFIDPVFGQLLPQLRADPRTAQLPVAVYCEPNDVESTRISLGRDPLAAAIYQPRMPETLASQLTELLQAAAGVQPAAAERLSEAKFALSAIGRLLAAKPRVFNLRPLETALVAAAWHPAVGPQAAAALGSLGSVAAQRTLVDVASAGALPLELRQAAAKAFCESVIRFNILLTKAEILRQYDRYNASESAGRETQQLLGAILDAIEARNAPVRALSSAPAPMSATPAARATIAPAAPAVSAPPAAAPAEAVPAANP